MNQRIPFAIHCFVSRFGIGGSMLRGSGILMHITSLPGSYGVGTFGKEAYKFVDFLQKAGQRYWQVLPLTPTGYGDSPYLSCSTYAGNPYLIDLDLLAEQGLLETREITACNWGNDPRRVDFGLLYENRMDLLRKAFARYQDTDESFAKFRARNDGWLPEFAHYMALKDQYDGKPWYEWPDAIKHRQIDAMNESFLELSYEIRFYCFVQYLFEEQWNALREYAHSKGVSIIGDVPIYVPYDSVEVWSNSWLFQLDENLTPTAVAGCPPDYFNENGQLWGNPLYRWDVHKKDGYRWWLQRLQGAARWYDVIRIDHFRAFAGYYAIPYGEETAKNGRWIPGPAMDFIGTVQEKLPSVSLIAEDLGLLTDDVRKLLKDSGLPGMKVLEFAFDADANNEYLPHTYPAHCVCYTGTHDNMPLKQWLEDCGDRTRNFAMAYMAEPSNPVWGMIRLCMGSVAELAIVPMQDFLELGSEGRMNFPGTCDGTNWTWRAAPGFADDALAESIHAMTKTYGRI